MTLLNDSIVEPAWEIFPEKRGVPEQGDEIFTQWNFQDFQDSGYLNFRADRADLFALSIMVENYAAKHKYPLLASFEDESRYKFVEDRYIKLMKTIPRVWVIGNFNNPNLAQTVPPSCKVISCIGTPISTVWAVVTRGSDGPVGLIADEVGNRKFKGFFTTNPDVMQHAVDLIAETLVTTFDFNKSEYAEGGKGGY